MVIKNISLQLPLPVDEILSKTSRAFERAAGIMRNGFSRVISFFLSVFRKIKAMRERKRLFTETRKQEFEGRKFRLPIKKYIKPLIVLGVLGTAFFFGVKTLGNKGDVAGDKIEVGVAEKNLDINKEFVFPLKDGKGEKVSEIKYTIEKAEIRDEIIVKGQKATAVKGRTFLILVLKISNEFTQSIEISTKDYVRLSVNGNEEVWLAPDIHNDPVEVQAISTKYTRVGFAINDGDQNLVLRVGEIESDKEKIPLNF